MAKKEYVTATQYWITYKNRCKLMKKVLLVGGHLTSPSNYLTLDTDREAVTPGDKLILAQDKANKNRMEESFMAAIKALLSLPIEVINAADGGQKKLQGVLGRLIDAAWTDIELSSSYRATYSHPTVHADDRINLIETVNPDLVFFFGEEETNDFIYCQRNKIPMLAPRGWSDLGDRVFQEIAWNKKHYFGNKSIARKTSKAASAFSLFGYLYKEGVYAPYFAPENIHLVVSSILSLSTVRSNKVIV